jgi:hypothetical protein
MSKLKLTDLNQLPKADAKKLAIASTAAVMRAPRQQAHQKAARNSFQIRFA